MRISPEESTRSSAQAADSHSVSADCYSDGERRWMEYGQRLRAIAFGPLLKLLTTCRVTPDSVTLLSAIAGLAFVPLALMDLVWTALGCLALHILLDGIDGPLARFQQTQSARGSFTDTFADQFVVTAVTITWMIHAANTWAWVAGSVFVFIYALVVAMAMVRNALSIPYSWLVRPRFLVYTSAAIDLLLLWQCTFFVLVPCNVVLIWKAWTGFRALRRSIPGPNQRQNTAQRPERHATTNKHSSR